MYDGISTKDVARVLTMIVRLMIEQDPSYSKLAANSVTGSSVSGGWGADVTQGELLERHRQIFQRNILWG